MACDMKLSFILILMVSFLKSRKPVLCIFCIFVLTPCLRYRKQSRRVISHSRTFICIHQTFPKHVGVLSVSRSVVSNSLPSHGQQTARLLCPWGFPGNNTGVGCHSPHQGIIPTQGLNLGFLHCRQILYLLSHQGSTREACGNTETNPAQSPTSRALQSFNTYETNSDESTYYNIDSKEILYGSV